MSRLHLILLFTQIALIAACRPISGKLTVVRNLALEPIERDHQMAVGCLARDGDCGNSVVRRVDAEFHPGVYDARLQMDVDDAIQLTVNDRTTGNAVFEVATSDGVYPPKTGGRFTLTAEHSGQPFDVDGLVKTEESSTSITAGLERCSLKIERQAGKHPGERGKNLKYVRRCRHSYEMMYGNREVEFHHVSRIRTVTLDFNSRTSTSSLARFTGSATKRYKVYDYRGQCILDHIFVRRSTW